MDLIIVPISFAAKLTLAREINWIFLSLHWTHLVSMIYFFFSRHLVQRSFYCVHCQNENITTNRLATDRTGENPQMLFKH